MRESFDQRPPLRIWALLLSILVGVGFALNLYGAWQLLAPLAMGALIGRWWVLGLVTFFLALDFYVLPLFGAAPLDLSTDSLRWDVTLWLFVVCVAWVGVALGKAFATVFQD